MTDAALLPGAKLAAGLLIAHATAHTASAAARAKREARSMVTPARSFCDTPAAPARRAAAATHVYAAARPGRVFFIHAADVVFAPKHVETRR